LATLYITLTCFVVHRGYPQGVQSIETFRQQGQQNDSPDAIIV